MKVTSTRFPGWNDYPAYHASTQAYPEVDAWMRKNGVESFLLSSGHNGYVFQVRSNHAWFLLKWA